MDLTDYLFVRVIASGSSGVVCEYVKDGIPYAIKLIPKINASIAQEIAILTRLNGTDLPVPRLYEHGPISGVDFLDPKQSYYGIVMQYIEGVTLEDQVLPPEAIRNLAIWLFDTLRHLHALNIVHRDIKPSNILLQPDGKLYLVDFGLACSLTEADTLCPSQVISTPNYIAPEGLLGYIDLNYRYKGLDVWAAGVTLYYVMMGESPWEISDTYSLREYANQLRRVIMQTSVTIPDYVADPTTISVTKRALTKDSFERPSANELYSEFFK